MKKQTNRLTTAAGKLQPRKMELIFLVLIATIFYRNVSSRRLPSTMPPNAMGLVKQAVLGIISEAEKLSSKLAVFFYNLTGASMMRCIHDATAALCRHRSVGYINHSRNCLHHQNALKNPCNPELQGFSFDTICKLFTFF